MMTCVFAPRIFVSGEVNLLMLYDYGSATDFNNYQTGDLTYTDAMTLQSDTWTLGKITPYPQTGGRAPAVIIEVTPHLFSLKRPSFFDRLQRLFRPGRRLFGGTGTVSGGLHGTGIESVHITYQIQLDNVEIVLAF